MKISSKLEHFCFNVHAWKLHPLRNNPSMQYLQVWAKPGSLHFWFALASEPGEHGQIGDESMDFLSGYQHPLYQIRPAVFALETSRRQNNMTSLRKPGWLSVIHLRL